MTAAQDQILFMIPSFCRFILGKFKLNYGLAFDL